MRLHRAWSTPCSPGVHRLTAVDCAQRSIRTASQARYSTTVPTTVLNQQPAATGLQRREAA